MEDELSTKMAGEIVLSGEQGRTIRKWRELVGISQSDLSQSLDVSSSVISDYERKRRSPGSKMVKRIVQALVKADSERGSSLLKAYTKGLSGTPSLEGILDMKEFASPMKASDILDIVKGTVVVNEGLLNKDVYGYTALDSVTAILELSSGDFYRIYGLTSERALIFTRVGGGRSPFIAIRVSSIKPGLVVLHGLKKVDALGIEIAERERIPVILSGIEDVEELLGELRRNTA
ncbi:MAG: helix-turn-helix domain-containing protein [Candidatus Hydrothermarchaeales archaeon]